MELMEGGASPFVGVRKCNDQPCAVIQAAAIVNKKKAVIASGACDENYPTHPHQNKNIYFLLRTSLPCSVEINVFELG